MKKCLVCGIKIYRKYNESKKYFATKKTCSVKCANKLPTPKETLLKQSISHLGQKQTIEARLKNRESQLKRVKDGRHNCWKGGVTPINEFTEEVAKKREYRADYRNNFGVDIVLEPTKLNLTPALQKLQDKLFEALK